MTAYSARENGKQNIALSNKDNIIMVPDQININKNVLVYHPLGVFEIGFNNIIKYSLSSNNIVLTNIYRINQGGRYLNHLSAHHDELIRDILNEIYKASQDIVIYTYEHLSNRKFNGVSLTQLDPITNDFSDIYVCFNSIKYFLNCEITQFDPYFFSNVMVKILNILAKLGGARSILKYNAIDLMLHLAFFKKIFIDPIKGKLK